MGFSDARLAVLAERTEADVTARAPRARRAAGLQAHRHLRGRVRLADRLHVFDLRDAVRRRGRATRRSPRTRRRSSSSAAARTASARASSSTIAAATPASRCDEAGYETIMVNCNPGDRVDRLRHLRPALFRAADRRGRARDPRHRAASNGTLHGVIVQFGGQTPLKLAERAGEGRACRSSAPRPTPSTSPRTATASSACSTSSASSSRRTASPIRSSRRAWSRPISACRSWCARPTCSAAAPWQIIRDESAARRLPARHAAELVPPDVKARYPNDKTGQINTVLGKNPLLFDRYLSDAIEVDVDCLARRQGRLHRRHHGAHRGGRHPFRRFAPARCRRTR